MLMNETEFNQAVDAQLLAIEQAVEESGADIDYDIISGILTLEFADGSKIIVNRQTPARQIWVATRNAGHHLDWRDGQWLDDRDGRELMALLSEAASAQSGEQVSL